MAKKTARDENFHYFKIPASSMALYYRYTAYIQKTILKRTKTQTETKNLLKVFNKLIDLIVPDRIDVEQERICQERTIRVVKYFKKNKKFYFSPYVVKEFDLLLSGTVPTVKYSFESMVEEVVSSLSTFEKYKLIITEKDEYIKHAYELIKDYYERKEITIPKKHDYRFKAIACYIAISFGFHISKPITNYNLYQASRNAFKKEKITID
ncbi:MAG: hypothetical protein V4565_12095 [Bacteroidota bacterium]